MRDRRTDRLFERFQRQGDVRALGRVFDRTAPELLRVAMSLVRDPAEAEDLVQATFLSAIERAGSWDASRRLVPWLLGILVLHAHAARRERGRAIEPDRLAPRAEPEPGAEAEALELSEALRTALARVPPRYRAVLGPFLEEGKRAVDIARETGLAPGTVRMQIHRGLEHLRRALPAGLALGAAVATLGGRGLAVVRAEVVRHGAASTAALAPASTAALSVPALPVSAVSLGGLAMSAKLAVLTLGAALVAALVWVALPEGEPPAGGALEPTRSASRAPAPPEDPRAAALEPGAAPGARRPAEMADRAAEQARTPFERALCGLTGRLLEHDGTPRTDARVELLELRPHSLGAPLWGALERGRAALELVVGRTRSDGEGRFVVRGAQARGLHALAVDLGGERPLLRIVGAALSPGELVDLGDFVFDPVAEVRGRLVDASGEPVAGARVRRVAADPTLLEIGAASLRAQSAVIVMPSSSKPRVFALPGWLGAWTERLPVPTSESASDGSFRLRGPQGMASLVFDREGFESLTLPPAFIGPGEARDIGVLRLSRGRRVEGRVVGMRSGQPVEGAEVYVGSAALVGGMQPTGVVVAQPAGPTDAEGRFALAGLPASGPVVAAYRAGPSHPWMVSKPDGAENVLRLPLRGGIGIQVQDTEGNPVSGARVLLVAAGQASELAGLLDLRPSIAQEEPELPAGYYVVRELPFDRYGLLASAPGYGTGYRQFEIGPVPKEIEVVLPPLREVELRVLDDETGAPVPRAEIAVFLEDASGPARSTATTDADGRAVVDASTQGNDEALVARVDHPAYATAHVALGSARQEEEVRLGRGGALLVRAIADATQPAGGLLLLVQARQEAVPLPLFARTDANGEARIALLEPGSYSYELQASYLDRDPLELLAPDFHPTPLAHGVFEIAAGETTEVAARVSGEALAAPEGEGFVAGRVRVDGRPAAGVPVAVHHPRGSLRVTTDARGEFDAGEVPAGRVTVLLSRTEERGGVTVSSPCWVRSFQLGPGEARRCDVAWTNVALAFEVVSESGAPAAGVEVHLVRFEEGTQIQAGATTDADGRARVLAPGPGSYQVEAQHPELGVARARVRVAEDGESAPVRLALSKGVPCAGTIELAGGLRLGGGEPGLWLVSRDLSPGDRLEMRLVGGARLAEVSDDRGAEPESAAQRLAEVLVEAGRITFRATGLRPGRWVATFFTGAEVGESVELTLPEGGDEGLVLRFEPIAR